MTVEIGNIRAWLGLSAELLDDACISECLSMGTDTVRNMVMSLGGSGIPDTAVKNATAAYLYRAMDMRNIKPAGKTLGGVSVTSDVGNAFDQFMDLAGQNVREHINATIGPSGRSGRYLSHARGFRGGCRR